MQRSKTNPDVRSPAHKPVMVTLQTQAHLHRSAADDDRTWSDRMRQIEQLEDPERWDGMS